MKGKEKRIGKGKRSERMNKIKGRKIEVKKRRTKTEKKKQQKKQGVVEEKKTMMK